MKKKCMYLHNQNKAMVTLNFPKFPGLNFLKGPNTVYRENFVPVLFLPSDKRGNSKLGELKYT